MFILVHHEKACCTSPRSQSGQPILERKDPMTVSLSAYYDYLGICSDFEQCKAVTTEYREKK